MSVDSADVGAREGLASRTRTRLRTHGTTPVLIGSALSGLGAYLFQVLGTRALGEEAYAPIGVLWTIQYLALSIALFPSEAYVTRHATLHGSEGLGSAEAGWRAGRHLLPWMAGLCVLLLAVTAGARVPLFGRDDFLLPVISALTVGCYGMFVVVRGTLAGTGRFGQYGAATGAESIIRLLLAVVVVLVSARTGALAMTLPAGVIVATAWWGTRARRWVPDTDVAQGAGEPVALPTLEGAPTGTGRYLAATLTATACSQTLLAAGPLAVIALGASAAMVSVVFVTTTAARAPLVFAFGGILSRVLPPLTRVARAGDVKRLWRLATRTVAAALVLAALGGVVGWLLRPAPGRALLRRRVHAVARVRRAHRRRRDPLHRRPRPQPAPHRDAVREPPRHPLATALAIGIALMTLTSHLDPALRVGLATCVGEGTAVLGLLVATRIAARRIAPAPA